MMGVDGSLIKEMKENEDEEQAKKATSVFAYRVSAMSMLEASLTFVATIAPAAD